MNKNFYLYDVFNERYTRKIRKVDKFFRYAEDSDAFDICPEAKTILYVCDEDFVFYNVKIPDVM